jgi:hypothetical protein
LIAVPAAAEFSIRTALITQGDLWVTGEVNEPNTTITLDDSFTARTDETGHFQFRVAYHPATCTVLLKAGAQSRAVVIENCGQRGPPGPPGLAMPTLTGEISPGQQRACGRKAAVYTGDKGFRLLVRRTGRATEENPLRPLSKENVLVLEVLIAGKPATAYGPDFLRMLRGGSADELQKILGQPITWDATNDVIPEIIQIVSEDTSQVLTQVRFKECTDLPRPEARGRVTPPPAAKASPADVAPAEGENQSDVQKQKPAPEGARSRGGARSKAEPKSDQVGGEPLSPPQGAIY